jgi:hypothetical protein
MCPFNFKRVKAIKKKIMGMSAISAESQILSNGLYT